MHPQEILKKYWGYDEFRPLQLEIIQSVLDNKDTLALLPTGGGKSICFQVPGMMKEGVVIVITPLIALMKDQVDQLQQRNIPAAAIYSGMFKGEIDRTLDNFVNGGFKFLYVSPERLLTDLMIERAKRMKVAMLVIDEAHCISKWGHDFRPPYLKVADFKKYIPNASTIALTATATDLVKKDIVKYLDLKEVQIFTKSFARENLSFAAISTSQKEHKLFQILKKYGGSAIVYVKTRKRTQEVANFLKKLNFEADFYHAGLEHKIRNEKQKKWIDSPKGVVVATNAFGMGIDKPNVRSVVHLDIPENIEAYYQEAGRAGRDGKQAYAFILYNENDIEDASRWMELRFPPIETVKRVYQCLCNFYQLAIGSYYLESKSFDLKLFCETFGLNTTETHYCLKLLEENELISLSEAYFSPSKLNFKVNNTELYAFQVHNQTLGGLCKTLLRIYGGELFANFITISENEIARSHSIPIDKVKSEIRQLHTQGIVEYFEQNNDSKITFLNARYDAANLTLDKEKYLAKKKHDERSLAKMLAYTQDKRRCRMMMMQEYFDEKNLKRCGKCDNCLILAKLEIEKDVFSTTLSRITELLPISLQKIENKLPEVDSFVIEKTISRALDSNIWQIDSMGIIYKNEL
ncbi:ATP-dependent DNA helicase RecQ [Spirosomataceae bacterium TFI 002]|nr:ATP-dependent DNA helicase RecQ [Spirosomataceae bacterium TFI 002]